MNEIPLIFLILAIAFTYSTVGHGGATGFLILFPLFQIAPDQIRSSALMLNLLISFVAFLNFSRKGYFQSEIFFSLALGSVPLAFIGGTVLLNAAIYKIILGIVLVVASIFVFKTPAIEGKDKRQLPIHLGVIIGAAIGFVSGTIGIGGGIILSPLLVILRYATVKETAAISALFILVNSAAGLAGNLNNSVHSHPHIYVWLAVGFAGAMAGSYLGSAVLSPKNLKHVLTVMIALVGLKLLIFQ